MTKLNSGSAAKAGYYFNLKSWEVHPVAADGEKLPGQAGEQWVAISVAAALVLTPVLGLTFLMFVPFIGFYLAAERAVKPLFRVASKEASELAATMSPGWQPGAAHLTGKREEEKTEAGKVEAQVQARPEASLEGLAREIEARRGKK